MKYIFLLLSVLASTSVFGEEHCLFNDKQVKVGESVWVEIPEYVENISTQMKEDGYSQEEIDREIKYSDHTGHRLYCTQAYSFVEPGGKNVGEMLKITSYVMVDLNPYSVLNKTK
tara:strand:- start:6195 stop:6539 length:345 start_codon:yes stop_codon:yes gene_type:complete